MNSRTSIHTIPGTDIELTKQLDVMPFLLWLSGEDKAVYFVNQQWSDYTGRSIEQEEGEGWLENIHPDDLASCRQEYFNAFNEHKKARFNCRLKK